MVCLIPYTCYFICFVCIISRSLLYILPKLLHFLVLILFVLLRALFPAFAVPTRVFKPFQCPWAQPTILTPAPLPRPWLTLQSNLCPRGQERNWKKLFPQLSVSSIAGKLLQRFYCGCSPHVLELQQLICNLLPQPKLLSYELLDLVSSHFNLKEKEFFGLAFYDDRYVERQVYLSKPVCK